MWSSIQDCRVTNKISNCTLSFFPHKIYFDHVFPSLHCFNILPTSLPTQPLFPSLPSPKTKEQQEEFKNQPTPIKSQNQKSTQTGKKKKKKKWGKVKTKQKQKQHKNTLEFILADPGPAWSVVDIASKTLLENWFPLCQPVPETAHLRSRPVVSLCLHPVLVQTSPEKPGFQRTRKIHVPWWENSKADEVLTLEIPRGRESLDCRNGKLFSSLLLFSSKCSSR